MVNDEACRDAVMAFFPMGFLGIHVELIKSEDTNNRATTTYDCLIEIDASGYLLEVWHH